MKQIFSKYFGPSTLVTAAFIGPGTVTICTLAGVQSGYSLLWALVFSLITTIILQEMSARLGLITQNGFGEAIRSEIQFPIFRWVTVLLVFGAIIIGNAAYEGGNISGAVLGVQELFGLWEITVGSHQISLVPLLIGFVAFLVLMIGEIKIIQWFLIALVLMMSLVFLTTAVLVKPDVLAILKGMFIPQVSDGELLLVMALVGTTVVPYNLFLHASIIKEKYKSVKDLGDLRKENITAVVLGGIISASIIITSGATIFGATEVNSAADMADQLRPLLGDWAGLFLGIGLFSAGISSAITAPLAAAYAAKGIFGWDENTRSIQFRTVWMTILLLGVLTSMFGGSPVIIIQFAQVANGILLPIVAMFLLYLMNRSKLMGVYTNSLIQNILSGFVLIVAIGLGIRSLNAVFQIF